MSSEEELFGFLDDLEQQAEALYAAERAPEVADRSRTEYQEVTLVARLMASVSRDVSLDVQGLGRVVGVLDRVATDWCAVRAPGRLWVVLLDAVLAAEGTSERAVPEVAWSPLTRLGVGSVLRRLADSATSCVLHDVDGGRHDGVPRRVGHDFVEVTVGAGVGARVVLVALARLAAIQHDHAA